MRPSLVAALGVAAPLAVATPLSGQGAQRDTTSHPSAAPASGPARVPLAIALGVTAAGLLALDRPARASLVVAPGAIAVRIAGPRA